MTKKEWEEANRTAIDYLGQTIKAGDLVIGQGSKSSVWLYTVTKVCEKVCLCKDNIGFTWQLRSKNVIKVIKVNNSYGILQ